MPNYGKSNKPNALLFEIHYDPAFKDHDNLGQALSSSKLCDLDANINIKGIGINITFPLSSVKTLTVNPIKNNNFARILANKVKDLNATKG